LIFKVLDLSFLFVYIFTHCSQSYFVLTFNLFGFVVILLFQVFFSFCFVII